MGKYLHVASLGLQSTLVYRANFFFRALFALVPLTAMLLLWRAVFEGRDGAPLGGFTLDQMVTYYLIVMVVDALTAVTEDDWQIAADIKDGRISQFLLKPVDYLTYRFCLFGAGRVMYTLSAALPVAAYLLWQRAHLSAPPDAAAGAAFAVSVLLALALQFLIAYTMALLAFWVLEVATFIFIQFALEYIASGQLFPLDLLPPAVQRVLELTPYPYLMFFPVSVYLGRISGDALWRGLAIQAAWVALAYLLARLVWSRGIRKYSAAGG
jgi:ABC-2 type transport system permease protein